MPPLQSRSVEGFAGGVRVVTLSNNPRGFATSLVLMRRTLRSLALLPLLALPLAGMAQNGPFEPSFYLFGHKVKLNGAGNGKVDQNENYKAGLYLSKPARSLFEALQAPGPKRLQIQILRDMPSNQLGLLLSQTLNANLTGSEIGACMPGLGAIGEAFGAKKKLAAGDLISLDGVMTQGTQIFINGEKFGSTQGPAFFECLLRGYLGDKPLDPALKKALLTPPPAKP